MTGTEADGRVDTTRNCEDFTVSGGSVRFGSALRLDDDWTDDGLASCSDMYALYCVSHNLLGPTATVRETLLFRLVQFVCKNAFSRLVFGKYVADNRASRRRLRSIFGLWDLRYCAAIKNVSLVWRKLMCCKLRVLMFVFFGSFVQLRRHLVLHPKTLFIPVKHVLPQLLQ
jgi:hypothetical protein